jgi:LPXTG-motif cell wall-anchored protein
VTTQLTNALQLSTITDLLAGNLATVNDLDNDSKVERTAGEVRSHATSTLGSVDVLGLLNANVIDLMSRSKVAGTPGTASNESSCSIADVKVGGTDEGISLDGDSLTVAGTEIPVPTDQLDAVKAVVDSVLEALGVVGDVGLCDKEAEADDDGTSAAQRISAFHVELALAAPAAVGSTIGAGDELVRIEIDPTVQTSVAAQVASTKPVLPKTGAPLVGTLLSGIGLAGSALFIRRRFF